MFDPLKLKTIPVYERKSLVYATQNPKVQPVDEEGEVGVKIKRLAEVVRRARVEGKGVALGMGAHAIKLLLEGFISDLIREGYLTSVAMNGAAAFHDFELDRYGVTSEDVAEELPKGRFGMAGNSAAEFNEMVNYAWCAKKNVGEVLGVHSKGARRSILHAAFVNRVPVTIHPTIGADCVHMHPSAKGEAIGWCALRDFYRFCDIIQHVGVYINLGSAVTMPEVFLKAVSIAYNQGVDMSGLVTANLDMLDHYRPRVNVLERMPGEKIDIRARHEQTIPYLWSALVGDESK